MLWFKTQKQKDEIEKANGYGWAAARLLKGTPVMELQVIVECVCHFGDSSPFDSGISDALIDWKNKTGEEYDYM